ncbi:MAG TPA: META domain-containing protein [Allosphingosinicella sp.]|nr:META domain-containing protein [Allosphingosinicella sp.]
MSALLALLLAAAPYHGHGTEPFWGVTITGNRIVFESPDDSRIVATARPRAIRGGRVYRAQRLTVEIRHGECNDGMSDRYQADSVRVWLGRRAGPGLEGCGGATLAPASLADTAWGIAANDGEAVPAAEDYTLQFSEGRILGQAGCNHFSGPYREAIRTLTPGPIVATRMACPEPRMRHERRVLALLAGPVRFAYPDGETLVLTGNGGTIRLRRLP